MSEAFDLNFPRATNNPPATGVIKENVEDFYVEEILDLDLSGAGEHVWLWLEKQGQNTEYVAEKLAQFCKIKQMDVGFSGLKDRWAVTRQWFSVYLGKQSEPDWSALNLEGVKLLKHARHLKKLRRGAHSANKFNIVVRSLASADNIDQELKRIEQVGFPNYFGLQRFGIHGANLERGQRFFSGEIKASRSQRSFYLSAARSYLFNLNLARHVKDQAWLSGSLGGPLYGDETVGENELSDDERAMLDDYPVFAAAIHKNRLKLERRPYLIIPEQLSWKLDVNVLSLSFVLPPGCFATALLGEFLDFRVGLGVEQ